jgi:hypothetical protein
MEDYDVNRIQLEEFCCLANGPTALVVESLGLDQEETMFADRRSQLDFTTKRVEAGPPRGKSPPFCDGIYGHPAYVVPGPGVAFTWVAEAGEQ